MIKMIKISWSSLKHPQKLITINFKRSPCWFSGEKIQTCCEFGNPVGSRRLLLHSVAIVTICHCCSANVIINHDLKLGDGQGRNWGGVAHTIGKGLKDDAHIMLTIILFISPVCAQILQILINPFVDRKCNYLFSDIHSFCNSGTQSWIGGCSHSWCWKNSDCCRK